MKDLEKQNARLKRLLADAELDKAILREARRLCSVDSIGVRTRSGHGYSPFMGAMPLAEG
jgi:hypothetical protein